MLDKQTNLKNNFTKLVGVLNTAQGGLPNLHIGVITSDMGVKGADDAMAGTPIGSGAGSCSGAGKDGALQAFSAQLQGQFLSDTGNTDGTRVRNYNGNLEDTFKLMASAGAAGCGFEQPFAAMRRSFENPANAGFIRPNARLAIILLTDEDDCSVAHSTLYGPNAPALGQQNSFRCTRFGVTCDNGGTTTDEMAEVGMKSTCHSNEQSAYTADIGRYTTLLKTVKTDPRDVLFGAIAGAETPFAVELRAPPGGGIEIPTLVESCTYAGMMGTEIAVPGTRVADLAKSLRHGSFDSVCADLGPAMTTMGQRIKTLIGDPCLEKPIALPAQCEAIDQDSAGDHPIAACTDTTTTNCFRVVEDALLCPAGQHQKLEVVRTSPPPADTWTSVKCTQ
jgi:hypothetical protein